MAFQDIRRRSRRWLSAEEIRFLIILLLVVAGLLALNIYLARVLPGGEWFYLRWSGARAFLFERIEPYSTEIAQRVQEVAYGRRAFSSEYAYVLNDPFYIVLFYTPLALLADFTLARALWMLLSEAALLGTVVLAFRLCEWQPPLWLSVLLVVFGLFGFYSLNALVTGSPAILLNFLYLWILLALRSHSDELAGALLFLVAYQWEVGGLFFLFVIVFIVANRRWKVLAGFAMALVVLLVVSFLVNPDWGLPYIRAVLSDWLRGANLTFGRILTTWIPESRFSIGGWVALGLGLIVFLEWLGAVGAHFRRIVWAASLSLAATPLVGLAIFPSNHVVLMLPLVLILTVVWERWARIRLFVTLLILILSLSVPFGMYIQSVYVYSPLFLDLLSILPPLATVIGLYWMRWWAIRPPRTWFDQIGIER